MISGHGDDQHLYPNIRINFSSNVYSGATAQELVQHLEQSLPTLLDHYPEPEAYSLQHALGAYYAISGRSVLVCNGATEAIYLIASAYRGAKSVILQPTFSEYADACRLSDHQVSTAFRLADIPRDTDLVWLCNPNNPTGEVYPIEEIKALVEASPETTFILDQSYEYFTPKPIADVAEFVRDYPNTIIIHSLTKRYLLTGLRLGYLTATEALCDRLREFRMPWSVNALAIEAGLWIVERGFPETIDRPALWRATAELDKRLRSISGIRVHPTDTHILLLQTSLPSRELKERLAQDFGILIRDASNFVGLTPYHCRIATQCEAWNESLILALHQLLDRTP